MAKENIRLSYDNEEDIFSLFKEGSKVKFSFDVNLPQGDIVIDYDFQGLIVGLEFFNASSYFPQLKIVDIKNLKAGFSVKYGPTGAQISYLIFLPNISQPIAGFIPAPYNKKMILEEA
jgi:uncharacterized protein YuzE